MTRLFLILLAALTLTACASQHEPPLPPDCPQKTDKKPPIDGGIGGTGNHEECRSGELGVEE